ncbi:hypothetical protein SOVF_049140 [Spinacia oleracea]|nr:hypothetical protein SOVF_049140 [Spinacia oleracea]
MGLDDFYNNLQPEEPIIPQLEVAQQKKVIKSFKKLLKSECFDSWNKGFCEWCDEPLLPVHECSHSGDNWDFVVVYDEEGDYVIALEFNNRDAPKVFD